jgi:Winged helix DNA-binding domain
MDDRTIVRRRMLAQRLWGEPLDTPQDVVRWLGAMQAQEFQVAKWSIAQRTDGVTDDDVQREYADGRILRTHVLRPTWHFVAAEDIRWLLRLTAPRVHARSAPVYRRLELDAATFSKAERILGRELAGGRHRTRSELVDAFAAAGIEASGSRLAYIVTHAELEAIVCSGAPRGKQHTYALVDERATGGEVLDDDEALAELTRRYFTSRGPATVQDFVRWSSLTTAQVRAGLEMAASDLDHQTVDGRSYWIGGSPIDGRARWRRVDLVQGYDEMIMGYSESRDVLLALVDLAQPWIGPSLLHAILLGGRLIGHWRPRAAGGSTEIDTSLYRPLSPAEERALDAAIHRYGRFLGRPVRRLT